MEEEKSESDRAEFVTGHLSLQRLQCEPPSRLFARVC